MSEITTPPTPQRTILLRGDLAKRRLEGYVDTGLTVIPGMLVEKTATGAHPYGNYKPHASATAQAEKIVALEMDFKADVPYATTFQGGLIDDAYAAGDLMFLHICRPGDELYMWLPANAASVALTDYLTSNGDGRLKKWTAGTGFAFFKPLEAINNSAVGSPARIRARAL